MQQMYSAPGYGTAGINQYRMNKQKVPNKVDIINLEWERAYDHFRLRLGQRYSMDITFAEYVLLCQAPVQRLYSERNKKIHVGWVQFNDKDILIVKERTAGKRLRTALGLKVKINSKPVDHEK